MSSVRISILPILYIRDPMSGRDGQLSLAHLPHQVETEVHEAPPYLKPLAFVLIQLGLNQFARDNHD